MKGFIEIEINKLKKAEWNYKEDNQELLEKLIKNIEKNGFIENIIVRELEKDTYEVVNGNHRLDALLALNIEKVMCYNLGKIKETEAKKIAVVTNETRFNNDNLKLGTILSELVDIYKSDDLLETLPYDNVELDRFISILDVDWSHFKNDNKKEEDNTESEHKKEDNKKDSYTRNITLYFNNQEELEEFKIAYDLKDKSYTLEQIKQKFNKSNE